MNFHCKTVQYGLLLAVWMVVGATTLCGQLTDLALARLHVKHSAACVETENWDSAAVFSQAAAARYASGEDWGACVDAMNAQAEYLGRAGRTAENRGLIGAALAKGIALWGEESVRVADSYEALGAWHFAAAKLPDSAVFYLKKGLEARIAALGHNHTDVAASLDLLGDVYQEFSIFKPSLASYMEALQIYQTLEQPDSLQIAASHDKIGNALWYIPDYQEAHRHLLRAQEIRLASLPPGHHLHCESENNLGHILSAMGKPHVALEHHQKALKLAKISYGDFHETVARSHNGIGIIQLNMGDFKNATQNFKRGFDIRSELLGPKHRLLAESAFNMAIVLTHAGKYEAALEYIEIPRPIWISWYGEEAAELTYYFNQKAVLLQHLGDLEGALENYGEMQKILQIYWPEGHPNLATCHSNMGTTLLDLGDYKRALEHLQIAVNIGEQTLPYGHLSVAQYYNNLGKGWSLSGNPEKATSALEKAIELAEINYSADHPLVANANENLGTVALSAGQHARALQYFALAEVAHLKILGPEHFQVMRIMGYQGNTYEALGDIPAASERYSKALHLARQRFGKKHYMVALTAGNLAQMLVKSGQIEDGLEMITLAINASVADEDVTEIYQQPSLCKLTEKTYLLNNLQTKAEALLAWDHPDRQKNREAAFQTFLTGVELIDTLRISYSRASKIRLSEVARPFYGGGIRLAQQLFEQKEDSTYLKTAWRLIEKSRSTLLLEDIQDGKAKQAAQLPDSLLARETQIKVKLANLELKMVETEAQPDHNPDKIKRYQERILHEKQKLQALIKTFEVNYPQHYREKYALQTASIAKVQNDLLDENSILVEYFYGDSNIYVFTISTAGYHLQALPNDSALQDLVAEFVFQITDASYVGSLEANDFQAYRDLAELGQQLYGKVLAPVLQPLGDKPAHLVLVPDGPLSNLPFDALLTGPAPAGNKVNYLGLPYLLHDFSTRYAWSATVLSAGLSAPANRPTASQTIEILAFAPPYELWPEAALALDSAQALANSRASAARGGTPEPLRFAKEEVQELGYLFDADIHVDASATEANFNLWAPQARVLHIAGHGVLDATYPEYSNIPMLFSEGDSGAADGRLHISEIANMQLQAELVVLPVCHSNAGRQQSGEGIMSLSRAFSYAGVPNVIASQWSVDDLTGKNVSHGLYKHLSEGKTIAKALQLAKQEGLKAGGTDKAHPYYWASMVLIGHDQEIEVHKVNRIGPVRRWAVTASAVGFSLLLGAGLVLRRRKRRFLM